MVWKLTEICGLKMQRRARKQAVWSRVGPLCKFVSCCVTRSLAMCHAVLRDTGPELDKGIQCNAEESKFFTNLHGMWPVNMEKCFFYFSFSFA